MQDTKFPSGDSFSNSLDRIDKPDSDRIAMYVLKLSNHFNIFHILIQKI